MTLARWTYGGHLMFWCPACNSSHIVGVKPPAKVIWEWNGSLDAPAFSPSIKVTGVVPITDEQIDIITNGGKIEPTPLVCHSYVKNGMIEFCNDSTHHLSGKTVPLATIPDYFEIPPP